MRLDQRAAVAPPLQDHEARLHQHPRRAGVSELARGLGSGTGWSSIQVTACMSMCGVSWSVRSARQREIRSAHTYVATAPARPRRRVRSRSAPPYHLRPRAPYRRAYEGRECAVLTGVVRAPRRCSFCRAVPCGAGCSAQAQGPCEILRGERPERWRVPEECVVSDDKHKLAFCTTGPDKRWTRDDRVLDARRDAPRDADGAAPRGAASTPKTEKTTEATRSPPCTIRMTGSRRARRSPLLPWPCALAPARRRRWRAPNRRPSRSLSPRASRRTDRDAALI